MSELNLQRLSHFVAVVKAGSLGKAAKAIHLTQPALSKSIQKLEEEMGFDLFDRLSGSLALTPLGQEFFLRVEKLRAGALDVQREMELLRGGQIGDLKIFCGATVSETVMAGALASLVSHHPGMRIDVQVGDLHEIPGLLRTRQIDLGIGEYTAFLEDADLATITLPPQPVVFVCRSGHPLMKKRRRRVAVADFFAFPVVATVLPQWAIQWLNENHPSRAGKEIVAVSCNHYSLLKSILSRTDAVSGVPEGVVRAELDAGTLVQIPLDAPPLVNLAGIIHLRDRSLSTAARLMVDALTA